MYFRNDIQDLNENLNEDITEPRDCHSHSHSHSHEHCEHKPEMPYMNYCPMLYGCPAMHHMAPFETMPMNVEYYKEKGKSKCKDFKYHMDYRDDDDDPPYGHYSHDHFPEYFEGSHPHYSYSHYHYYPYYHPYYHYYPYHPYHPYYHYGQWMGMHHR